MPLEWIQISVRLIFKPVFFFCICLYLVTADTSNVSVNIDELDQHCVGGKSGRKDVFRSKVVSFNRLISEWENSGCHGMSLDYFPEINSSRNT